MDVVSEQLDRQVEQARREEAGDDGHEEDRVASKPVPPPTPCPVALSPEAFVPGEMIPVRPTRP